jgi:hypothetical protein
VPDAPEIAGTFNRVKEAITRDTEYQPDAYEGAPGRRDNLHDRNTLSVTQANSDSPIIEANPSGASTRIDEFRRLKSR